jgi:uncharacterized heparinase superfamily protein
VRLPEVTLPNPTIAGAPLHAWMKGAVEATRRQGVAEWHGSPGHLLLLGRVRAEGLATAPRDFRPVRAEIGRAIGVGAWPLAGGGLELGPGGDPWDRPSPSRAFAVELHQFGWLHHLIGAGEGGPREALRLVLGWERVFGRWNSFAWSGEVIERRVLYLACHLRALCTGASDAERALLLRSLARQARHLASLWGGLGRAAERAAAVGAAGAALSGPTGEQLASRAIERLEEVLPRTVLPDGGHASRAPEAALRLLFDLLSFDDALLQLGREPPSELARAIDRLTSALRFFTLPDGRLACFQGGEESDLVEIEAARAHDDSEGTPPLHAPHSGYEKLAGKLLQVIADAAPPADGPWSVTACAHPLAIEVVAGRDRLITNTGWSLRAENAQPLRLTPAATTAALNDMSCGAPLQGALAKILGARLEGGATSVEVRRHQAEDGVWLELSHDGWASFGLTHERRLFLDTTADELRGEDRFVPLNAGSDRNLPFTLRFHLHPDVRASLARDQRSILLQGPTTGGWWLRNDAREVAIEPSVHMHGGRARRSAQVVLRSQIRGDRGGRVRWKLARVEPEKP